MNTRFIEDFSSGPKYNKTKINYLIRQNQKNQTICFFTSLLDKKGPSQLTSDDFVV